MYTAAKNREHAEAERARLLAEEKTRVEAQTEVNRLAAIENERIANEQAATARRLAEQEAAQALAAKQLADKAAANLRAEREAQELAMRLEREAQAEVQRKANAELKAAQDALAASQAAHAAAISKQQANAQREADHAEALTDNATFDAAMARLAIADTPTFYVEAVADLARCNGMVDNLLTDARVQASLQAYADAGMDDPEVTDEEIIAFGAECGLGLSELVTRLEAFTVYARAELLVVA
jgi:colicin import membrane protein